MRLFRVQFTVWALMIAVAFVAIWSFLIAKGMAYQDRYFGGHSAWDEPK
jgi:hypothetical protein